jgi:type IV secretion system protein VirB10
MKLAMRLGSVPSPLDDNDCDPRERESAEIIDLASRTAYPLVTQRRGTSDTLGLVVGVAVVALLGAATLWGMTSARTRNHDPADANSVQRPAPALPAIPITHGQPTTGFEPVPSPPTQVTPAPGIAALPPQSPQAIASPYGSPTVVFDASALPEIRAPDTAPAAVPAAEGAKSDSPTDFASRLGGVGGSPATAASRFDPATTISQGTMIPAVLETAINTDVPGYVRAVVSQDVRSFDGRRVLVPRSSRIIGQYQSGLQAGQKRAYVIWTRLIRPDGVSVALASPATGFDGSAGLQGKVDSHFFQRFGSAMLLSVVGGLSAIGTGGAGLILGGGQSAAAAAVQQGNNIGPTIRVRPGEPIRVFTARDLDFSLAPRL